MIKIYVLINPITGDYIYVGSCKRPLDERLRAHIAVAKGFNVFKDSPANKRHALIKDILAAGLQPGIKLIRVVDFEKVDYYEKMYYEKFKKQGHPVLQSPHHFTFQSHNVKTGTKPRKPIPTLVSYR